MRKKTTWAASVVRKQLQTCCQHETLSLDTHEPGDDDDDQSCEVCEVVSVSAPVKDPPAALPSLFRRKSFNASHSRSLLTTPEPQPTPYRKSVDSSLPLCTGAAFKPRRLQYVRNSTPLPPPPKPKSGPLPMLRYSSFKETGSNSPVPVKKYLSGPLPTLQRNTPPSPSPSPSPSPAPAPPIKMISMSGKAKELRAAGALMRVKSSFLPSSKLPGMVTQGTLKKAAQLAKVTPVLERKGSRHGSRDGHAAGHGSRDGNAAGHESRDGNAGSRDGNAAGHGSRDGNVAGAGMERLRAAVKIQAAMRGYRVRKELAARAEKECASVSTRMSRTNPNPPRRRSGARRPGMEQVSKSWNGSLRTAQDCQARLKSKQEAARKRERALEYAMSRQRWKLAAGSRKSPTPASWVADNTFPDKPGWVWNWLERAARMGAHNSPNRIFDNNDFEAPDDADPFSDESLSVKSTVGVCTTELGSAGDMQPVTVAPMTYPWPLSLRQQHAAGLLRRNPSPLKQSDTSGAKKSRRRHPSVCRSGDELLSTSCVTSDELKPVRKLEFAEDVVDQEVRKEHGGDSESVGSCVGPLPSQYRLSSPFGGARARTSSQSGLQQQVRMSHPNSLNPQASQSFHQKQQQPVSGAVSEDDSAGTTAASVRRPFWRP